jgi:hypothetical protein
MISCPSDVDRLENPRRTDLPVKEIARYWSLRRVLTWLAAAATVAGMYAVGPRRAYIKAAIRPEDVPASDGSSSA